jgi:hypothetical protein
MSLFDTGYSECARELYIIETRWQDSRPRGDVESAVCGRAQMFGYTTRKPENARERLRKTERIITLAPDGGVTCPH